MRRLHSLWLGSAFVGLVLLIASTSAAMATDNVGFNAYTPAKAPLNPDYICTATNTVTLINELTVVPAFALLETTNAKKAASLILLSSASSSDDTVNALSVRHGWDGISFVLANPTIIKRENAPSVAIDVGVSEHSAIPESDWLVSSVDLISSGGVQEVGWPAGIASDSASGFDIGTFDERRALASFITAQPVMLFA